MSSGQHLRGGCELCSISSYCPRHVYFEYVSIALRNGWLWQELEVLCAECSSDLEDVRKAEEAADLLRHEAASEWTPGDFIGFGDQPYDVSSLEPRAAAVYTWDLQSPDTSGSECSARKRKKQKT